jgi:hypothetical protein
MSKNRFNEWLDEEITAFLETRHQLEELDELSSRLFARAFNCLEMEFPKKEVQELFGSAKLLSDCADQLASDTQRELRREIK